MKIAEIDIDEYIESLDITLEARNQVKQNNLMGDYIIDRSIMKYKMEITLNLLSSSEWGPLKTAMQSAFFDVTFRDDNLGQVTRKFTCDCLPAPRLIRTPMKDYYSKINITLEEM